MRPAVGERRRRPPLPSTGPPRAEDCAPWRTSRARSSATSRTRVRRERNKAVRSELKTRVKNAVAAAETGAEDADAAARLAKKRLDKAATKGVIHKNAAARRKSRLAKRLNAAARPPPSP